MTARFKKIEEAANSGQLKNASARLIGIFFAILIIVYTSWLISFWPGSLGQDSLAVLLEIQDPELLQARKPAFWHYFVKAIYQPTLRVEWVTGTLFFMAALVFSRILSWSWANNLKKTCAFLLLFFCVTPYAAFNIGNVYADGIYAVAATGLIFEAWLVSRRKEVDLVSFFMISLTLPIAGFFRSNGIVYVLMVLALALILKSKERIKVLAIFFFWIAAAIAANKTYEGKSHGILYPLALFETVNFMQPRPMNLWREKPRITEKTIQTLKEHSDIQKIISHYDKDYWDPLIYNPDGPVLSGLSKEQKSIIVKEFIQHNLWQNIPAFMGSRLNVFLTSVLAEGGLPSLPYTQNILSQIKTKSEYRPFDQKRLTSFWEKIDDISKKYRWVTWSPIPGFFLLIWLLIKSIKQLNIPVLLVTVPCTAQLIAIFFLSIAGEYRYLLPFFFLPVAALPMMMIEYKKHAPPNPT